MLVTSAKIIRSCCPVPRPRSLPQHFDRDSTLHWSHDLAGEIARSGTRELKGGREKEERRSRKGEVGSFYVRERLHYTIDWVSIARRGTDYREKHRANPPFLVYHDKCGPQLSVCSQAWRGVLWGRMHPTLYSRRMHPKRQQLRTY